MKKILVSILIISMLCFSITGAGFSENKERIKENHNFATLSVTSNHLSTEQVTNIVSNTVDKYLSTNNENYNTLEKEILPVSLPWKSLNDDLLEWWIQIEYNGQIFDKQVDISISDLTEKFLKHPEYGEILNFDVDSDPENDIEVIIGFYWSVISYPNQQDARSLEMRYRVRQMPNGGVEDQTAEMEVWSQIRVNYGLIKNPGNKAKPFSNIFSDKIQDFFTRLSNNNILKKLFPRFLDKFSENKVEQSLIGVLDNSDVDYIAVGSGYRSEEGKRIPLLVEKRFSFAKCFNYNWKNEGNIFNPTIFEHELYDVTSEDPIELLYGFQAFEGATDTKKYDVAFSVEFSPPIYIRTKWIPKDGYVYYNFDHRSRRYSQTEIAFTADVNLGSAIAVPKLILTLDEIDENLGRTGRWFSFDLNGLKGFKYEASNKFDVGIKVDVPQLFEEKIEIVGLPTSVECEWGIDDLDFFISPSRFTAGIDVFSKVTMNDDIDKIIVYYPTFTQDAPDSPLLEIESIPRSQRVSAGGSVSLSKGSALDVSLSANAGLSMSGSIGDLTVYYPKADWVNDPDTKLLSIPKGIPSSISASASGRLYVDLNNIMSPSNYVYGSVSHTMSSNFDEIDIFVPASFDPDMVEPIVKFTDIPSRANSWGKLYWGQLKGEFHSDRGSSGGFDPIEINLEYGDYKVYDKLEIRNGHIDTRFHAATDGYLFFDTSENMVGNILMFEDKANNHKIDLVIDEVSADDLYANWDVSGSGSDLKVNDLEFSGIINTLKNLELDLRYSGKSARIDLNWILGQTGGFEIDVYQSQPTTLNFNLDESIEGLKLNGFVTLPSDPHFDVSWKWHQGTRYTDPGYFKINQNTNQISIDDLNLYVTYNDMWGAEVSLANLGIYICVEWYWYNLMLYIWPVIDITGTVNLDLLLNGQWYDAINYENPP